MKYGFLAVIFLAVSCGKYEAPGGSSTVGQIMSMSTTRPSVSTSTQNDLNKVCQALATKRQRLTQNGGGTKFSFITSETDCNGSIVSSGLVPVSIQGDGTNFFFKSDSVTTFLFPNVETDTSGVFSQICASIGSVQEVSILGNSDAQRVRTGVTGDDCPSSSGQTCVLLETGSPVNGSNTNFRIHTREWIRIQTDGSKANYGFFTYRKKVSQAFCSQNSAVTSQAALN